MTEIIDVDFDEDEDEDEYYHRNARFRPRAPRRSGRRGRGRPSQTVVVRRPAAAVAAPVARSPIVHKYGNLKWGLIADAGAKALAAIQPLPGAPNMGSDATKNLQFLADYHQSLAEHAKRSQQLTTLGSIAKVFLP